MIDHLTQVPDMTGYHCVTDIILLGSCSVQPTSQAFTLDTAGLVLLEGPFGVVNVIL